MARDDFDDFFGNDEDTPVVDTRADGRLYRVPLGRISPNLVNPRFDFGTEDDLIDFGKSLARRQNQPCPVVSRGAYLKLWPDHADRIGDIDYVLVSGERRYRGATAVGLPGLDCVVNDDFAADRKTFMEAVVSENVDRQNFDPIEEGYAVQALVREFGSNRAVAQHFERVDGWVTQRVLLTNLAPEMQDLVRSKEIPLEAARKLGKLARDNDWDAGQQAAWWKEEQQRRTTASQARAEAKKTPRQDPAPSPPPTFHLGQEMARRELAAPAPAPSEVLPPPPAPAVAKEEKPASFTAVKLPPPPAQPAPVVRSEPETRQVPEPRPEPIPAGTPLPYDDGFTIAHHLAVKMDEEPFVNHAQVMNELCWDKVGSEKSFAVLRSMLDMAVQRDGDRALSLVKEFLGTEYTSESAKL